MRRQQLGAAAAAALIGGITLAACGDDSGGSSGGDNAITISASEYAYEIAGEATGGFVRVTFENDGEEPHIVVPFKLKDGKTSADALALLTSGEEEPDPELVAEIFDGDPDDAFYGVPGLIGPGEAQTNIANLPAGSYALVCFVPAPDGQSHAALGMVADLTIGEGDNAAPEADGTIEVTDDSIVAPDGIGSGTYAVTNNGSESSDFNMVGPTDAQPADFDAAINAYFGSIGSGDTPPWEFPAPLVAGFTEAVPAGATGYIVVDLAEGRYVIGGNSDDEGNTQVSGEFEVS
jgi:hypothetical protein